MIKRLTSGRVREGSIIACLLMLARVPAMSQTPTISSLSPAVGRPGTSVTITGTNFNTTAADNIVYFGATRATVTSASATSLGVTVPTGATYTPVSVNNTATALAAYSQYPFLPTFNNSGDWVDTVNFESNVNFVSGATPSGVVVGDLDGDGKSDLVVANQGAYTISVYHNTSISGSITAGSFAPKVDLPAGTQALNLAIGDLDGDGKPDIVVANPGGGVTIYRNASTPGSITTSSFAARVDLTAGSCPNGVAIDDFDGDGKPDLATANFCGGSVSVLRNISTPGALAFAAKVDFTVGSGSHKIVVGDLDGDGKHDIVTSNYSASSVSILRNTSTSGTLAFAASVDLAVASSAWSTAIGDLDGDGKLDLAIATNSGLDILRNTSTPGSCTFAGGVNFATSGIAFGVAIADMNGDGKPDIAMAAGSSSISVFRNISSAGSITSSSFAARVNYPSGGTCYAVVAGDLDGDGRPDLAVTNQTTTNVSILRNSLLSITPITGTTTVCVGASTSLGNVTTGGTWSSSDISKATVDTSGVVTGVSSGSAVISYTAAGGTATTTVTVNPLPSVSAIGGNPTLSTAITTQLSNSTGGGVWTSSNPAVGTVSATGLVTGFTAGTANISYTVTSLGCSTTQSISVNVSSVGVGLHFDGSNDYVSCGNFTLGSYTKEAWVYLTNTGLNNNIVSGTDAFAMHALWAPGGRLGAGHNGTWNYVQDPTNLALNTWYHVAVTYDVPTTTMKLYKNGVLISSNSSVPNTTNATGPVFVGAFNAAGNLFQGKIDEVRIWNTARTQEQIQANMNCDVAQNANLIAYYRFDDGVAGGTNTGKLYAVDYSGNNRCGTLNNFTLSGSSSNFVTGAVGSCNAISIASPGSIAGTMAFCKGATTTLSATVAGGTWSTASGNVTIGTSSGVVTGVNAGTAVVSYRLNCQVITATVTVNPTPGAITGYTSALCQGTSVTLGNTVSGGSWTSSDSTVASVGAAGALTGVMAGSATISYILPAGCATASEVLVNPLPHAGVITGDSTLAAGSTILFNASLPDGSWSSSNSGIATVSSTGDVTGAGIGTAIITYAVTNDCGTDIAAKSINIFSVISAETSSICVGSTMTLNGLPAGGAWSSSNIVKATVSADGIVTGVGVGTVVISYNASGSISTVVVTVNTTPTVTGLASACIGTTATLTGSGGGTWSSSSAGVASVASNGVVTGNSVGTAIIEYTLSNGCKASKIATVNVFPEAIEGPATVCVGATMTLTNSVPGGAWSSSKASLASVGTAGNVTGVVAGTPVITYAIGACMVTRAVSVLASPALIGGTAKACPGTTATLTDATAGGTWSSSDAGVGTVSATGVVTGVAAGTTNVFYTISNGCSRSVVATINPNPDDITGAGAICVGSTISLSSATAGGSWYSSNTTKATVHMVWGTLTGVAAGTANISYRNAATGCITTAVVTVNTAAASITGSLRACPGATTSLSNATAGGAWSSSNPAIATIDGTSGVVTGVVAGTSTIVYTIGGGCSRSAVVTINAGPAIGGTPEVCQGKYSMLTSSPAASSWVSSNTSVATVSSGNVGGISAGTADITVATTMGCKGVITVTVNPLPPAITGTLATCVGSTTTLNNALPGGTWSHNAPGYVNINSSGVVTGLNVISLMITYTSPKGCIRPAPFTVQTAPTIEGSPSMCIGTSTSLSVHISHRGGTWSSSDVSRVLVGSTGVATGVSLGTSTISYTSPIGCKETAIVTVNTTPDAISGASSVCIGDTITLSNSVGGGAWSGSTSYVTVGASGSVTGATSATATVSYTIGSCSATQVVTILPTPAPFNIVGSASICEGATTSVSSIWPGTWSSPAPAIATVSPTGVVTGVSAGNGTIVFTGTNGCQISRIVTVNVCGSRQAVTGVKNTELNTLITMFPNPTNGILTINTPEAGTLSVFAVDGKEVASYQVKEGDTNIVLPKELAAGVYMCRFIGNEGSNALVRLIYQP